MAAADKHFKVIDDLLDARGPVDVSVAKLEVSGEQVELHVPVRPPGDVH